MAKESGSPTTCSLGARDGNVQPSAALCGMAKEPTKPHRTKEPLEVAKGSGSSTTYESRAKDVQPVQVNVGSERSTHRAHAVPEKTKPNKQMQELGLIGDVVVHVKLSVRGLRDADLDYNSDSWYLLEKVQGSGGKFMLGEVENKEAEHNACRQDTPARGAGTASMRPDKYVSMWLRTPPGMQPGKWRGTWRGIWQSMRQQGLAHDSTQASAPGLAKGLAQGDLANSSAQLAGRTSAEGLAQGDLASGSAQLAQKTLAEGLAQGDLANGSAQLAQGWAKTFTQKGLAQRLAHDMTQRIQGHRLLLLLLLASSS